MAMIYCTNCGKSISDKAVCCPQCGASLIEQNDSSRDMTKCSECGNEYKGDLPSCPTCGCPTPGINAGLQKPKRKHKVIIISVLLVALVIIGICVWVNLGKKAKEKYYNNMEAASYAMLEGAAVAEKAGNLIKDVWYNAIFEEKDITTDKFTMKNGEFVDDFNDALSSLFVDESFNKLLSKIEENQSEVAAYMKELQNPPKEYEEAYSVLKTYYDNYLRMTKMVINPTGSLQSFSEDLRTSDTDTVNSFEKMKLYFD